jgi:hypothetical protein
MGKARLSLAIAATTALAALALAACGGSDNSDDEDQITDAIELAATSGDPKACTEAQTQKFTEQVSGEGQTGEAAVKACEESAADTAGDEVDVSDIEVDGDSATAQVAVTGSTFDGQTLDIGLVKEGDQWKLDDFRGFTDFDREAFNNSFREGLTQPPDALTPEQADCVMGNLDKLSDQEVQDFFTGSPDPGNDIFGPCFKGQG